VAKICLSEFTATVHTQNANEIDDMEITTIKTVVITGGAQGIGRVMAEMMAGSGYQVAVWDSDPEALSEERERWQNRPEWLGIVCDVSDEKQVEQALNETLKHFGSVDILINNAAISANIPISQLSVEEFRKVIDINLNGAFICTKYCEPELRRNKGAVINICSTRAFQSEANTEAYSASKGGIFSLTHALAVSMGPDVRINSISPGWIDVSAIRKRSTARQENLSEADHLQHPAGRVGKAEDIGQMVLFLCDPANSFITGQNFTIDGGMTRRMIYV
jgi:NAD(P)-dependent dehydrogenase (short-subunit alcohol dehydrogenase family)